MLILHFFWFSHDSGGWTIAGAPLDLNDPRLLAMAAAERRLLESDYDEYADSSMSGAAFFRSAALIVCNLNPFLYLQMNCITFGELLVVG